MTTDPITQDDGRRARLVKHAQQLDAELSVLMMYDHQRRSLGYDYGNGQRFTELIRVRRERDAAQIDAKRYGYGMGLGDLSATPVQMRETFVRISTTRLGRVRRADAAYRPTKSSEMALRAWRAVQREVEAIALVQ